MKKFCLIAPLFLLFFAAILSIWLPRRDLRTTAQVAGIALDQGEEGLIATFEIYRADMDRTIGSARETVVGYGSSLDDCLKDALRRFGKELFINDASVLIIGLNQREELLKKAVEYYSVLSQDHMDLPVVFSVGHAGTFFEGEGAVVSPKIADSLQILDKRQTVKDLMNHRGDRIYMIQKEDGYEIQG